MANPHNNPTPAQASATRRWMGAITVTTAFITVVGLGMDLIARVYTAADAFWAELLPLLG